MTTVQSAHSLAYAVTVVEEGPAKENNEKKEFVPDIEKTENSAN